MKKLKVMTILGTRPEIIRLSRIIVKLDMQCDHVLVHTGQNFDHELNEIFFNEMEIREPNYFLNSAVSGDGPAATIGKVIAGIDPILESERPDAVLILGDTNSSLAAIAVKRRKIPIFHMEAGNRSFDMRVPEEINRRIVDHVADVNLTYSDIARQYLIREGVTPELIIKTGSPMLEVISYYLPRILNSSAMIDHGLEFASYYLVSVHREENIENPNNFRKFVDLLNGLALSKNKPIVVSTHPRTRKRIEAAKVKFDKRVKFLKPLSFFDYVALQISACAVLSDSGTITEESSILNFPALNLRESHERPEGFEEASVMMAGLDFDRVVQCLAILEGQPRGDNRSLRAVADYSMPNVSEKVLRIIHSYTDYVNRVVWKKY